MLLYYALFPLWISWPRRIPSVNPAFAWARVNGGVPWLLDWRGSDFDQCFEEQRLQAEDSAQMLQRNGIVLVDVAVVHMKQGLSLKQETRRWMSRGRQREEEIHCSLIDFAVDVFLELASYRYYECLRQNKNQGLLEEVDAAGSAAADGGELDDSSQVCLWGFALN